MEQAGVQQTTTRRAFCRHPDNQLTAAGLPRRFLSTKAGLRAGEGSLPSLSFHEDADRLDSATIRQVEPMLNPSRDTDVLRRTDSEFDLGSVGQDNTEDTFSIDNVAHLVIGVDVTLSKLAEHRIQVLDAVV